MVDPAPDIPNPVTAPPEMLIPAIAELLRRIPETWQTYTPDTLTATQSQALYLLVGAGLVERRGRIRLRMMNHPTALEATYTLTGESGGGEAFTRIADAMWNEWQDAWGK